MQNQNQKHIPVLLEAVLKYLEPKEGESYLDLTAGYGGHAAAILKRTGYGQPAVLVDRDKNAVDSLSKTFESKPVEIVHNDFFAASEKLLAEGKRFDMVLADLGVSSPHLDMASRGFSFGSEGPLDMRMDQQQTLTAEHIVNNYSEQQLTTILRQYGEEPKARAVARAICENRPIRTTTQLASIVARTAAKSSKKNSKTHPATKTFQALRIEVNSELDLLAQSLPLWIDLLVPGGRLVVISFHSLEDRIVKQAFQEYGGNRFDSVVHNLTRQPVMGDKNEIVHNPRARSAKLRAVAKIKTEGKRDADSGQKPLPVLQSSRKGSLDTS